MHIVVLLKQVLDWEIPAQAFRVDRVKRAPAVDRAPYVMSLFDGNALEVALKLREARASGDGITVLTLGPKRADEMLKKALALTADAAVRVNADDDPFDSAAKARVLAAAIQKLGGADLILAGRQAADWEAGQVGGMIAEELGLPCVPFVSRIEPDAEGLKLRQELDSGYATVRLGGAAVVTVTNDETNVLRSAKVKDVLAAAKKPITVWELADLGVTAEILADPAVEVLDLALPEVRRQSEIVEGETPQERAVNLARRLRELNVI